MENEQNAGSLFAEAVAIMARLRAPGGCPWDREQTFESIQKHTLEETYEVFDAIDRRSWADLADELGDLLLQVLFYAEIAAEPGYFSISDVIAGLNRKLVRRHPHVFGEKASAQAGNAARGLDTNGITADTVLANWSRIKLLEKESNPSDVGLLDSVPRSFPALLEARKLGSKAATAGFDWPDVRPLFDKVREELAEVEAEVATPVNREAIAAEIGDLLFTVVNLARRLDVDPEFALRGTNARFRSRFAAMEGASAVPLEQQTPAELERLWASAKERERAALEKPEQA